MNRDPIEESGGVGLYVMALNNAVNRIDFLGLKCRFSLYFGHGGLNGEDSEQDRQLRTDLGRIEGNDKRHADAMKDYASRTSQMNPSDSMYPKPPVNENCGTGYGYGGCQPNVSNSKLPSQYQAIDPNIFKDLLDKNGDIPLTEANVKEAITRLLHAGRDSAVKACTAAPCCTEVIVALSCSTKVELMQGSDSQGRPIMNKSLGQMDSRCGKFWKYNCKQKQWTGPHN